MLEVSTLRSPPTHPSRPCSGSKAADEQQQQLGFVHDDHPGGGFLPTSATDCCCDDDFVSMVQDTDGLLLDYIDFSSCDVVVPFFDADGDVLPDLEADPTELLAEFSSSPGHDPAASCGDEAKPEPSPPTEPDVNKQAAEGQQQQKEQDLLRRTAAAADEIKSRDATTTTKKEGEEASSAVTTMSTDREDSAGAGTGADGKQTPSSASAEGHHHSHRHSNSKKKLPAAAGGNSHGKRKVKVDWTPELHRRFVQAVEQLGIDKAVPSRILEIMGIQCLTRHNIASHLQKYRSHRKHLMAREAEAASWAQKRQMYAAAAGGGGSTAPRKPEAGGAAAGRAWVVPTMGMGFPPPAPFCRPLHVWGHPPTTATAVEAAAPSASRSPTTMLLPLPLPVWPRHLAPPARATWAHPPAVDPACWQQQQQYSAARKWVVPPQPAGAAVTQGTPVPVRFPAVPGMVPMYRPATMVPPPPPPPQSSKLAELQLQLDAHPSKESIDAAIGDVLVKPWLPLPLGLKPPSLDSVMSELHKQGIPKVPPAATA